MTGANLSFRRLAGAMMINAACVVSAPAEPFSTYLADAPLPQQLVYRPVGKTELKLHVFHPLTPVDNPAVVMFIHGGAWTAGDATVFFPHARYFASRGMLACSVEYRLLTPDGPTRLTDAIDDCAAAVKYIRDHAKELGIDPKRVAVVGDSAGGHLAACLVTTLVDAPSRADAAVLCNPITDLTDGDWYKYAVGGALLAKNAVKTPPTAGQLSAAGKVSPVNFIAGGLPQTLVLHGTDDQVVLPAQSVRFAEGMEKSGNRCTLELIDGARHAFVIARYTASEQVVVDTIRRIDTFLTSLGFATGEPTLSTSDPPAWMPRPRPATKRPSP